MTLANYTEEGKWNSAEELITDLGLEDTFESVWDTPIQNRPGSVSEDVLIEKTLEEADGEFMLVDVYPGLKEDHNVIYTVLTPDENKQPNKQPQMPRELVIHGKSDDLIEVDGDVSIEASEPFDRDFYLVFGDGTILNLFWGDRGIWCIDVVTEGHASISHYKVGKYDGSVNVSGHSEAVKLTTGTQLWMSINGRLIDFTEETERNDTINVDINSQK